MTTQHWTHNVRIRVVDSTGQPVTSAVHVRSILSDLYGLQWYSEPIEPINPADGVWNVSMLAEDYGAASDEGGLVLTHSAGFVVAIPMGT